jgi:WD40 repeat protein
MRKVRFWDLETLEPIQEFCGHDTTLESVSMRPDGKFVAYLDAYGFLQMKRSDGTPVFEAFCRDAEIFTIDWDKGCLAVGYADGRVEFHQSTLSNSL